MKTESRDEDLFLGLDLSTQGLKATLINAACQCLSETSVQFDSDLPEFNTQGGAHHHPDGLTVTSPPMMWTAALDMLLDRLKKQKVPIDHITAVSGSGQQHGSVYLRSGADQTLKTLNPDMSLKDQAKDIFTIEESPIWMDSSTTRQCKERDTALGGPQAMATLTGSRSYERFTANQIAKIFQEQPDAYNATERIVLVSSFMASLLIGKHAPIEPGDGAGMNLMDIHSRQWSDDAMECTAPDLKIRLGQIVPSHSTIGMISAYYTGRYGFAPNCIVIAFSGDNPNSLAAMQLDQAGDIAVSLGTSDTVFGALSDPKPSATEGHIFGNPINPEGYMALVCYKNGSLTRESVRDEFAGHSWQAFEDALARTPPGNKGHIGFYFKEPEITPHVLLPGIHQFDADNSPNAQFTPEENIRAIIEGQFLSMRLHARNIGLIPKTLLATGGASVNKSLTRIMANVFGIPVNTSSQPNSASWGAAYRALHGWHCKRAQRFVPFSEVVCPVEPFVKNVDTDNTSHAIYTDMLKRYEELEQKITEKS